LELSDGEEKSEKAEVSPSSSGKPLVHLFHRSYIAQKGIKSPTKWFRERGADTAAPQKVSARNGLKERSSSKTGSNRDEQTSQYRLVSSCAFYYHALFRLEGPMRHIRTGSEPLLLSQAGVDALAERLREAAEKLRISLMYLHGAHALGNQTPLSDLDIAVLLNEDTGMDSQTVLDLQLRLQGVSGREDVDLAVLNFMGPMFRANVVRHGRLLYKRTERERILFEASAVKEALDFIPYSNLYNEALFNRLKEGKFLG
jgi:predicted nucleotidyltransferase